MVEQIAFDVSRHSDVLFVDANLAAELMVSALETFEYIHREHAMRGDG